MKLTRLRITNFRNHADSTLELDASFCVVRGQNYAGKSSIGQAISMLLTPSTESLDSAGHGFVTKIRSGQERAVITGDIQGSTHLIRRSVALSVKTTGRTDNSECLDDPEFNPSPLDRFLEFNRAALGVALNTSAFVQMDEKAQKALLARLVLPSHYDFPKDTIDAVDKALGSSDIHWDDEPFSVIEKAYKLLYAERQAVNRQVKEFVIPEPLAASQINLADLTDRLKSARAEWDRLAKEKDEAVRKSHQDEVLRTKLTTEINGLLKKLEEDKTRFKTIGDRILSPEKLQELRDIIACKDEAAELSKLLIEKNARIPEIEKRISRLKTLPAGQPNCFSCGQPVSKEYIANAIKEDESLLASAKKERDQLVKSIEVLGDVEGANRQLADYEVAQEEKKSLEASMNETVTTGKAKRAELAKLGDAEDVRRPFNEKMDAIQKRIDGLNEQMRPAIAAEERAKEITEKTEKFKRLEAKAKKLDELTKYFDKDGIKAKLLAEHIGSFESRINGVLRAFGYRASLTMEPFKFEVTTARGYTGPFKELSRTEKHLFLPAFQCAVASASGVGIAVIDDMDVYLENSGLRQKMYGELYGLVSDGTLDQVFIIEASTNSDMPKKQAPGSCYFFVADGTVQRLGA